MLRVFLAAFAIFIIVAPQSRAQPASDATANSAPTILSPGLDPARRTLDFAQRFRAVCDDIRAIKPNMPIPPQSVLADFQQNRNFLQAIGSLCANGNFDYDESANDYSCPKRHVLSPKQVEFIRNFMLVKTDQPIRRISLRCVEIAENITLSNISAGNLYLTDVTAERLLISYVTLSLGLSVRNSSFRRGFAVYASEIGGLFEMRGSHIGSNDDWKNALWVSMTSLNEIVINAMTIAGTLNFNKLVANKSVFIGGKTAAGNPTTIDGTIRLTDARIGGLLEISELKAKEVSYLDYVSALRLTISNSEFDKRVYVDHSKFEREALIEKSTLLAGAFGRFISTPDLRIENTEFSGVLDFDNTQATGLLLTRVKRRSPDCDNCNLDIFNSIIGSLRIRDSDLSQMRAGNGRFHTAIFARGSIGVLNCEDCLVDQYVLVATKIRERADLKGAEIKGTLAFSEGPSRVCWGIGSILDMAELKADVLAINARDLVIEPTRNPNPDCVSPEQDANAAFVPSKLTGARYRTITGGRISMEARTDPDAATRKAAVLPTATDISEERLIGFVRGYKAIASVGYDPQPYEEMAAALARAGETEKAVALRVARIDERIANTGVGWLERGWFWIYRQLSDYGYKNERTAKVFCLLLLLGTVIHQWGTGMLAAHFVGPLQFTPLLGSLVYSFWFSLDRAIPPLNLELMKKEDMALPWGTLNYFYLHRVFGTGLISVFAAGAAGLGQ